MRAMSWNLFHGRQAPPDPELRTCRSRLLAACGPERQRMLWVMLERPGGARVAVATVHATARIEASAARDVELAADRAVDWANGAPLLFGGDLNPVSYTHL